MADHTGGGCAGAEPPQPKLRSNFFPSSLGGVAGVSPAEGVAEDAACGGWSEGETSPFLLKADVYGFMLIKFGAWHQCVYLASLRYREREGFSPSEACFRSASPGGICR
jgi:hypothetical protein